MTTLSSVAARQYLPGPQCNSPSGSNKLCCQWSCSVTPQNTISHVKAVLCLRRRRTSALYQWCRYNNFSILSACSLITYMVRSSNKVPTSLATVACRRTDNDVIQVSTTAAVVVAAASEWGASVFKSPTVRSFVPVVALSMRTESATHACMALANQARTCSPKQCQLNCEPG